MDGRHALENEWKEAPSILRELAVYIEKLHHDRAQEAPSAASGRSLNDRKSASVPANTELYNRLSEEEGAYLKELMGRGVASCRSMEGLVSRLLTLCKHSEEAAAQGAATNALLVERCRRYKKQALDAAEQYKLLRQAYGRLKKRSSMSPRKPRVMTEAVAGETAVADPCDSAAGPLVEQKISGCMVQRTPHALLPREEPGGCTAALATPVMLRFAERSSPEIVLTQEGADSPPQQLGLPGCLIRSQQGGDVCERTQSDDQIGKQGGALGGQSGAVLQDARNGAERKQQNDGGMAAGQPFKYREAVRGKRARENLQAQECEECARFYAALESWGPVGPGSITAAPSCGHTVPTDRQALCALSSRHRYVFAPPDTPNGFWDMGLSPEGKQGQRPSAHPGPTPRRLL